MPLTETDSRFVLLTVIVPVTSQLPKVPESCVTVTVYVNLAEPPGKMFTSFLSTDFAIDHVNLFFKDGVAVFVALSGAGSTGSSISPLSPHDVETVLPLDEDEGTYVATK
jgi:hypothetical protein